MKFLGKLICQTIGSDPEFFITKNGQALPSCLFLDDDKIINHSNGYKIFKDNLLIEGNIPYAYSTKTFLDNMHYLKGLMEKLVKPKQAYITSEDAMVFAPRFLAIPDAQNFGCSGYFDAWEGMKDNLSITKLHPTPRLETPLRTAGFHIHLGIGYLGEYQDVASNKTYNLSKDLKNTPTEKVLKFHINRIIARVFDLLVTNPSRQVYVNKERALGYGKLGSFRMTKYGLECRSLGGYFTRKEYLLWVAIQSIRAVEHTYYLIKKDPQALIYFSNTIKLGIIDDIYINPRLYKEFGLDYDKEINRIYKINKTINTKKFYEKTSTNLY